MYERVVITGLGVVAPNAIGLPAYEEALRTMQSGISFREELQELGFGCCVAGVPPITEEVVANNFTPLQLRGLNASGMVYGVVAGKEAWRHAGLPEFSSEVDADSGVLFGTGISGTAKFREAIYAIDKNQVRRLGSTAVLQTMSSSVPAWLASDLGLGNQVSANSSACATGTESLLLGYERIRNGNARRMLCGSCSDSGPYIWGGFEAMRILPVQYNQNPEKASRPMSTSASGFVPSSGAGAYVLESLSSAQERGATIYAEVLGGFVNSGGGRNGGSTTAPNPEGVQKCIRGALRHSGMDPGDIDVINGHLTGTSKDVLEVENWVKAIGVSREDFPYLNSFKGLIGHGLAAAGSLELVACVLELTQGMVYGNCNAEDLHPEIEKLIGRDKVPLTSVTMPVGCIMKASFGFGDVNACVLLKSWQV